MKKVLCFLLSLSLLCSVLVFGAAAKDDPLRLIVASDLHWRDDKEVTSDRFFHPRDSLGQLSSLTPLIVDRFLKDAAASDADCLLLTGDLTDSGSLQDAAAFAAILASFEEKTGKQVFVINGNHDVDMQDDVPAYAMDHVQFREIYRQFGYDEALAVDDATSSYAVDLKDGYRLLAINSNEWNGGGNSTTGKLVLDAVYVLLAARAAEESPVIQKLLSSKILAWLGLKSVDNLFTRGALDLILNGLMIDKAPGDNNVTLPGYGKGADSLSRRTADAFHAALDFFRLPFQKAN